MKETIQRERFQNITDMTHDIYNNRIQAKDFVKCSFQKVATRPPTADERIENQTIYCDYNHSKI